MGLPPMWNQTLSRKLVSVNLGLNWWGVKLLHGMYLILFAVGLTLA